MARPRPGAKCRTWSCRRRPARCSAPRGFWRSAWSISGRRSAGHGSPAAPGRPVSTSRPSSCCSRTHSRPSASGGSSSRPTRATSARAAPCSRSAPRSRGFCASTWWCATPASGTPPTTRSSTTSGPTSRAASKAGCAPTREGEAMSDRFDVAILGAGPAGEHAAFALVGAGRRVVLIERELIGGECSNWACIPTKTLLRPAEVRSESEHAAGTDPAALNWPELDRYRDYLTGAGDDSGRVKGYEDRGVTGVKGDGRVTGPGRLEVDGNPFSAEQILITTGSDPVIPPIDGLAEAGYWTNREATALHAIPSSAVIIGGGPVGIELAQFLHRFGTAVTVAQGAPRLVPREDVRVCDLLTEAMREAGLDVRLDAKAVSVRREGDERVVTLE